MASGSTETRGDIPIADTLAAAVAQLKTGGNAKGKSNKIEHAKAGGGMFRLDSIAWLV